MAVAVDHHRHPFKPTPRNRRHRLLSFPHLDIFDLSSPNLIPSPRPTPTPEKNTFFHRSLSTPCLYSGEAVDDTSPDQNARVEIIMGRKSPGVNALVVEAAIAMASGARLLPAPSGLCGAYYLRNRSGENFAVVKHVNEEPVGLALGQPGIRRSISVGETGVREVAAYVLDHGGFSGVPPTALVKISHPALQPNSSSLFPRQRIASIQRFVPHDFDAGELGPSRFSVSSVHRIGILDTRLLNVDRHSGNILVKSCSANVDSNGATDLVPIDHGFCLPELLDDPYFEWLHWPQASVPFSETEIEYISTLDPSKDADLLRSELPLLREASIRILVLCTIFLKKAATAGLCLADIGDMMTRRFSGSFDEPRASVLETICRQVEQSMLDRDEDEMDIYCQPDEGFFQFDMEFDNGDGDFTETRVEQAAGKVDLPMFLPARPNTPRKSLSWRSMSCKAMFTSDEEAGNGYFLSGSSEEAGGGSGGDGEEEEEEPKVVGSLTRSVSFTVSDPSHHGVVGGSAGGNCVSFKGMSSEEWALFLERFEELLPEAFEGRKGLGGMKQGRLGTSCMF